MADGWELGFADDFGRYFARMHGLPPVSGRTFGWLIVCDPQTQTIAEIATALHASRSAASGAVAQLESWSWITRTRTAGERVDRVRVDPDMWVRLIDNPPEYLQLAAIAASGLEAMPRTPADRRERLVELAAFTDFVASRMPALAAEWRDQRATLIRRRRR